MNYKKLTAGDIRQPGDEVRHLCNPHWHHGYDYFRGYTRGHHVSLWHEVQLLSHSILPADLMNAEFRRPV